MKIHLHKKYKLGPTLMELSEDPLNSSEENTQRDHTGPLCPTNVPLHFSTDCTSNAPMLNVRESILETSFYNKVKHH